VFPVLYRITIVRQKKGRIVTLDEADKICKVWQAYMEFHDKLFAVFSGSIPESFLPFPIEIFEEALNIVAKHYFDIRDHRNSKLVADTISFLMLYKKDEKAIESFIWHFSLPDVRKIHLENLKKAHNNWLKINIKLNGLKEEQ
jgi:hypothetical protein